MSIQSSINQMISNITSQRMWGVMAKNTQKIANTVEGRTEPEKPANSTPTYTYSGNEQAETEKVNDLLESVSEAKLGVRKAEVTSFRDRLAAHEGKLTEKAKQNLQNLYNKTHGGN